MGSKDEFTMGDADFYAFVCQPTIVEWSLDEQYVIIGSTNDKNHVSLRRMDDLTKIICFIKFDR